MRAFPAALILLLGGLAGTAAWAQQDQTGVEQIGPGGAPEALGGLVPQISSGGGASGAPAQVAPREPANVPPPQLTGERGRPDGAPQLNRERRSTAGTAPLSSPAQGRTAATARIQGEDRCDPQTGSAREREFCARVLENRADDFERPVMQADTRSPEERLLGRDTARSSADAGLAARRLANGDIDDSLAAQAVASGELARQDDEEEVAGGTGLTQEQSAAAALVEAIIINLANRPPN